jgi:hypothetical protein
MISFIVRKFPINEIQSGINDDMSSGSRRVNRFYVISFLLTTVLTFRRKGNCGSLNFLNTADFACDTVVTSIRVIPLIPVSFKALDCHVVPRNFSQN